jgi:hypothetical protein
MADVSIFPADASINSLVERSSTDEKFKPINPAKEQYHDFASGAKKRKYSNQTHVSSTDPDCGLSRRPSNGYVGLSYKAHYSIDAESRIVTDCYVSSGSCYDSIFLCERIDFQIKHYGFEIEEVVADKAYGNGPIYSFLKAKGIRSYIPVHDRNSGKGRLTPDEFKYNRKKDIFISCEPALLLRKQIH